MTGVSNELLPLEQVSFVGLALLLMCYDYKLSSSVAPRQKLTSVRAVSFFTDFGARYQLWVKRLSFSYLAWSTFNNVYMTRVFLENYCVIS